MRKKWDPQDHYTLPLPLPDKVSFDDLNWQKARKKPVVVEFAELDKPCVIETLEGRYYAHPKNEFIIRGVEGEYYPIKKSIFYKTYDIVQSSASTAKEEINNGV